MFLNIVGSLFFAYLLITLLMTSYSDLPFSCLISQVIFFGEKFPEMEPTYSLWAIISAKFFSQMKTICFIILG